MIHSSDVALHGGGHGLPDDSYLLERVQSVESAEVVWKP